MSSEWHGGKGSKARKVLDRARYEENYHRIFGYKDKSKKCDVCGETDGRHTYTCEWYDRDRNYKEKQKELTELNADGNEDRGRFGEDLRQL